MAKKLKVEYVPIAKLRPFAGNPRKNDETVASIIKSIEAFGYTNPILARRENSEIIAGHTRVLALEKLGATEAPVIFLDLSETDARVYSVFDNKSVENTEWDFPKLADLLTEFDGINVDMELTGFAPEEIEDIVVGPNFSPVSEEEQSRLDQKSPVTCPECGHEFTP
jgi:ParB-like chromosome segregation protein Spo0J